MCGGFINYVSENVFNFKNPSDQLLEIHLWSNLNEESFALNSLTKFKRPVKFYWQFNHSNYLKQEIFKPFLDADERNMVIVTHDPFNDNGLYFESDHRNHWNQSEEKYKKRVILTSRS